MQKIGKGDRRGDAFLADIAPVALFYTVFYEGKDVLYLHAGARMPAVGFALRLRQLDVPGALRL